MATEFRKTPPAPLAPVAFRIPEAKRVTLSNGLRLVMFSDRKVPLINLRLVLSSGETADPTDVIGLTSAVASLVSEGTENYSSRQLAEEVERLGASLGANSGSDSTVIAASALSLYRDDILRLMAEITLRPTFPEDELELYKKNTIEGLKFQRSQASFLADEQFAHAVYGEHPYAIVSPAAEHIERLTREMLASHHRKLVVPPKASFIAIGDFEPDELVRALEAEFGGWSGEEPEPREFASPEIPQARRLVVVDRPGSAQANILIGNLGMARNDPDFFPVLVLNQILGAGASSRLFMNLREEKGYTYGAYSKFNARKFGGDFEASAEVRTEVVGASVEEFMKEFNRVRDEEVAPQELLDAKNFLTGVYPLRAETQDGLTGLIVQQEIYSLPDDYLQTYRDKVAKVSAADVQRVAAKFINPDRFTIVIVGDGREILRQTSSWANEISCFDIDGKNVDAAGLLREPASPEVDLTGTWSLVLDFQGQNVPVTLGLTQKDGTLDGSIESPLGKGEISGGRVSGREFSASASIELQGQELEMTLRGECSDREMSGAISSSAVPAEISFSGSRK